jgi:CheY-like chemotaxis protein
MKPAQPASLKILLADDDFDDCFFFGKALKEIPMTTQLTTVHDGEQLMNYLNKNPEDLADILFLDLNMPRKTGLECLTEIKQSKKLKDLHVVTFSTFYARYINYERDIVNNLSEIGAHDNIRKPGDFEKLKEVIHNALIIATEKKFLNEQRKIVTNATSVQKVGIQ